MLKYVDWKTKYMIKAQNKTGDSHWSLKSSRQNDISIISDLFYYNLWKCASF